MFGEKKKLKNRLSIFFRNVWENIYYDKCDDFDSIETCGKKGTLSGGRRYNVDELFH